MGAPPKDISATDQLSELDLSRVRTSAVAIPNKPQLALIIYSRDGVQTQPLADGQRLVVGRAYPADIVVRDSGLSRGHAVVERCGDDVWCEDLDSTNGTWVNESKIARQTVPIGAALAFGPVQATIRRFGAQELPGYGGESHDRFVRLLNGEAERAKAFGRQAALVMLKALEKGDSIHRSLDDLHARLRPFDHLSLYSHDTLEVMLPEVGENAAIEFAEGLCREHQGLVAGLAVMPDSATSAEELQERARSALRDAKPPNCVQVAQQRAHADTSHAQKEGEPIAASPAMRDLFAMAERVSSAAIPVLIRGETGSGKEVVARKIHAVGSRKDAPFVSVNCAALAPDLLMSTLFGHERGSFTGANTRSRGVFETANGGIIFLDEIGELPPAAQAAVLRVLETKRFSRLGSVDEIEVDVRVLTATHRDLEEMCRQGQFRDDLLFRLNALTLVVPPLRDRPEDLEPLASYFLRLASEANSRPVSCIEPSALELMQRYDWPGNIRELRNAIDRAVVISRGNTVTAADLPESIRQLDRCDSDPIEESDDDAAGGGGAHGLRGKLEDFEAGAIQEALQKVNWDRAAAAAALDIPLRTLSRKMQQYEIKK